MTDLHPNLTRTLVLTIALPDYWCEDDTPEKYAELGIPAGDFEETVYDEMQTITPTCRLLIATGDKGGNELHNVRGVILAATTRTRERHDDLPEDERLTEMIAEETGIAPC